MTDTSTILDTARPAIYRALRCYESTARVVHDRGLGANREWRAWVMSATLLARAMDAVKPWHPVYPKLRARLDDAVDASGRAFARM